MIEVVYHKDLVYINAYFYSFWMPIKEYEKFSINIENNKNIKEQNFINFENSFENSLRIY